MGKELIQDIKQPKRRLADILPAGNAAAHESVIYPRTRRPRRGRWLLWLFVFLIIFGLPIAYFASQFFVRAEVIVTPKKVSLPLDQTLRAVALPVAETTTGLELGYETMTVQATEQVLVAVSDQESVSEKATGQILITNRYSSRPQRLVAKTRFAAPDGRIYRILKEVIVPGYTLSDGKITGGELEATIEADQPGAEYNGELKTLTIPGFKGDPKFDKITARGVTAMTHGFVGERAVVSVTDQATAEKDLTNRLRATLETDITTSLPDGFLTFESGKFFKAQSRAKDESASATNLTLEMNGELTVLIFSRRELSRTLATTALKDYDGAEIEVVNFDALKFDLLKRDSFDPATTKEAELKISGQAEFVWQFDQAELKKALAGVSQDEYQTVFLKFPNLVEAEPVIQPPWLTRFPSDPAKIKVVVQ